MSMINVILSFNGYNYKVTCKSTDLFIELAYFYCQQNNLNQKLYFFHNNTQINYDQTNSKSLEELEIKDGDTIYVNNIPQFPVMANQIPAPNPAPGNQNNEYMNIIFELTGRSAAITIQATKSMQFCELAQKFLIKAGVEADKKPSFLINSKSFDVNETRTLGQLNINNGARINVVLVQEIIGA